MISKRSTRVRAIATRTSVLMGILAVLPYASLLFSGDQILRDGPYSDYGSFQLPVREFVQAELLSGRFPHWIPWLGCGIPLHAAQQVGICYPLCTPLLFVLDANRAIKLALFLHAILCYVGQYRVSRQLGISESGSAFSGLVATLSGFFCTHLAVGHVALVYAYALIPWLLSCVISISHSPGVRTCGRFALVVGLLLLIGQPQVPYYALLFTGIWAAASLTLMQGWSRRLKATGCFAAGLVLGVSLAAVQLLPAYQLFCDNNGMSGRTSVEYASTYALNGADLLRFFVPSLLGNPLVDLPEFQAPDFYHEKVGYMGWMSGLLAAVGLYRAKPERWAWGAAGLVMLAVIIALGKSTPLFSPLCSIVPGMTLFRCPGRCLSVMSILLALLAGRGLDSLAQTPQVKSRQLVVGLLIGTWLLVNGLVMTIDRGLTGFDLQRWMTFAANHLTFEIFASLLAATAAAGIIGFTNRMPERWRLILCCAALMGDALYFNVACLQYQPDSNFAMDPSDVSTVADGRFLDGDTGFRSDQVRYSRMVAAAIRSKSRMIGTNEGGVLPAGCEYAFRGLEKNQEPFLQLASCSMIVRRTGVARRESAQQLPRIWFCPRDLDSLLQTPAEQLSQKQGDQLALEAGRTRVTLVEDGSQRIRIQLSANSPGTLIIADTWYPGWTASVDGLECDIQKAFGCFRAIPVPTGVRSIAVTYQPREFRRGLWVTFAAIFVICITQFKRMS